MTTQKEIDPYNIFIARITQILATRLNTKGSAKDM